MNKYKLVRWATMIALFCTLEVIISQVAKHLDNLEISVIIALPFASSLAARAIAYLEIFEWLRAMFTEVVPHSSGAGEDVHPKMSHPTIGVIGGLISCINCAGMWAAALLLGVYAFFPTFGSTMIYILAAASIGILFTRTIELVEWKAHEAHEQTGYLNRINKRKSEE